jgi:N-acetylglucosaminyldiphosphoundecaprenol N-acetyl-beta-D-mannosaminyltransferase
VTPSENPARQRFAGVDFDLASIDEILEDLKLRVDAVPFAYAVTPNVDHIVRLHDNRDPWQLTLRSAYRGARWRLCDSRILARLASFRGVHLPVVTGSDLTARLFAEVIEPGNVVCIIGGDASTVSVLERQFAGVGFVQHIPPMGLRDDREALERAADFVVSSRARYTFIVVGSPQQEMLAQIVNNRGNAIGTGLCVGAAIAFLTGDVRRAPLWMQRNALEWAHRLFSDPSRLWRRYLVTGPRIFRIAMLRDAGETE